MHLAAHHLVISGFRQHRGRIAGCDRVVARLNEFRRPGVRVELLPWNADWRGEAQFIARHAAQNFPPLVCVFAYSWGFGWGAIRLAEALGKLARPLRVYGLVGCDGVYRHGYHCGNWRALWPWTTIRLPGNVDRCGVTLFAQQNTLPAGHRVVDATGREIERQRLDVIHDDTGLALPASHLNLDEARPWIDACAALAAQAQRVVGQRVPLRDGVLPSVPPPFTP